MYDLNYVWLEFVDGGVNENNGNGTAKTDPNSSPAKAVPSPTSNADGVATDTDPVKMEIETDGDTSSKKEEDKTASVNEIKTEKEAIEKVEDKDPVDEEMNLKQKNQLNQRELFLSKQVEILPATNIRGKCSVTLLNETESFSSYIDKEVLSILIIIKHVSNHKVLGRIFLYIGVRSSAANFTSWSWWNSRWFPVSGRDYPSYERRLMIFTDIWN